MKKKKKEKLREQKKDECNRRQWRVFFIQTMRLLAAFHGTCIKYVLLKLSCDTSWSAWFL